jgi:hypothetical protein
VTQTRVAKALRFTAHKLTEPKRQQEYDDYMARAIERIPPPTVHQRAWLAGFLEGLREDEA